MTPRTHENDRPRQENPGAALRNIDRGGNQLYYMKPPYAPHVELSLYRGARSGMADTGSFSLTRRTAASPMSNVLSSRPRSLVPIAKTLESTPRVATAPWAAAPKSISPARYRIRSPRSILDKFVSEAQTIGKDPDRPRQENPGAALRTLDRGGNQTNYIQPPYAPHVQLSLYRGARSGMDTCSRRRPGH